ncbi:MAG: RNA polymerase sigma factor [Bacteroidales bacterium]
MSKGPLTDHKLVERALQNSDQAAYTQLMQQYHDALYKIVMERIGNYAEAEDLTMEIFTKAFRKLHTFNPQYAFSTWIYNIAIHHCIDHLKKKKLPEQLLSDTPIICPPVEISPNDILWHNFQMVNIEDLIEKLPFMYQEVFYLRYVKTLKYKQIAKRLNIPLGTVKIKLFRGKAVLTELKKHEQACKN